MSGMYKGDIAELFESVNTPVKKEEMVAITEYFKTVEDTAIMREGVEWLCETAGVELADFYHLPNHGITPFCYYKGSVFLGFNTLDKKYLEWTNLGEGLELKIEMNRLAIENGNFGKLLDLTDTIGRPLVFEYLFHQLPDNQKYELFIDLYTIQEYGFTSYNPDIVKEALEKQSKEKRLKAIQEMKGNTKVDESGNMLIYRGMGSSSTPVELAMSWTLSPEIAHFFANRMGAGGYVVKAQIHVDHVIDYLDTRNDKEVIALSKHVTVLENQQPVQTVEEMELLEEKGLISEYQNNVKWFLREDNFINPSGIHGVLHTKRVLLHCLSLGNAIGVPANERGVLIVAALYHDIGRTHDYRCTEHGKWSMEKKGELNLTSEYITVNEWDEADYLYLSEEEEEVMEFLVTYHCRHDNDALKEIDKMEEGEKKEMVKRLFPIFKDADALDRVRIGDLDPRFLRTAEAKKRLRFAEDVYKMLA